MTSIVLAGSTALNIKLSNEVTGESVVGTPSGDIVSRPGYTSSEGVRNRDVAQWMANVEQARSLALRAGCFFPELHF